jgi:hypothetical protein
LEISDIVHVNPILDNMFAGLISLDTISILKFILMFNIKQFLPNVQVHVQILVYVHGHVHVRICFHVRFHVHVHLRS